MTARQKLEHIEGALRDYHFALDSRQHGGVAADHLVKAVEHAFDSHWQQGAEAARRKASESNTEKEPS